MSKIGMGGAVASSLANGSTKSMSRQEKDMAMITCGMCGSTSVALGNYYYVKTRQWNKRYQKYYDVEFYSRRCIKCANQTSREYSKEHRQYHAKISARAWRRNHGASTDIRWLELQKDYSYRPRPQARLESERLASRKLAQGSKSNNKEDV